MGREQSSEKKILKALNDVWGGICGKWLGLSQPAFGGRNGPLPSTACVTCPHSMRGAVAAQPRDCERS